MTIFPRVAATPLAALLLVSTAATPLLARTTPSAPVATPTAPTVDTSPWLFKGSDIPPDPEWHFGRLPNGLRYAVRRNGVPPGQVAVRVRIDAGSLNERDPELGFAHLIEHLSFRGSKYVPDGDTKRVWQRLGATFGSDSNASTTPTQTVYKLDLPAATESKLDESLKIFSGMMIEPAITPANLASERPAVLAEQREAPGAQVRYSEALLKAFYAGQPLADRSPIGTIKTLEAATPGTVQAFHDRWYRPENAVVVISGDIDPDVSARLIVKYFADWQGRGAAPAVPDFGKPDPTAPRVATIAEPSIPPVVTTAVLRPWVFQDDTVIFNQKRMVDQVAIQIINRRLETRARAGGSFLTAGASLDDVARSANGTFMSIMPLGNDWAAALKDVRATVQDATTTPPTQAEIDRELAEYDAALLNTVNTARVEAGAKQADDMVSALDIRETVAGPQVSYDILQGARKAGMFTPATILASTKRLFATGVTRALVNTQTADPTAAAKLTAALDADVSKLVGKRVAQAQVEFASLPSLGIPGKIVSREMLTEPGIEKITFANGVRMLLYANSGETGRVYLQARFGEGARGLPANRVTPAWAGDLALVASGIGKLDQGALDALTTGRRIGLDFDTREDAFVMSASTTPTDYADNLRLMALKLAYPRWDAAPIDRARAATLASYAGYTSSPNGVLSRDLGGLLRDGDPRWSTPTKAAVEKLDAASFRRFWEPLLQTGPIEISVFGDLTADDAIAAVAKTFGALKPRAEDATDSGPDPLPRACHNAGAALSRRR